MKSYTVPEILNWLKSKGAPEWLQDKLSEESLDEAKYKSIKESDRKSTEAYHSRNMAMLEHFNSQFKINDIP